MTVLNNSKLNKPANFRESILVVVAVLALCYVIYTYLYNPKKMQVVEFNQQLSEVEKKVEGTKRLVQALAKKQDQEAKLASIKKKPNGAENPRIQMITKYKKPVYKNISELLNAIAQPNFRSSIIISSLKYSETVKMSGYQQTSFNMQVSGQFGKIVDFLERLEEMPVLMSLDSIKLSVNKVDTDQVLLQIDCTYYQLENNNV